MGGDPGTRPRGAVIPRSCPVAWPLRVRLEEESQQRTRAPAIVAGGIRTMTDFFGRLEDQLVAKSRALAGEQPVRARRLRIRRRRYLAVAVAMLGVGGSAIAGSE